MLEQPVGEAFGEAIALSLADRGLLDGDLPAAIGKILLRGPGEGGVGVGVGAEGRGLGRGLVALEVAVLVGAEVGAQLVSAIAANPLRAAVEDLVGLLGDAVSAGELGQGELVEVAEVAAVEAIVPVGVEVLVELAGNWQRVGCEIGEGRFCNPEPALQNGAFLGGLVVGSEGMLLVLAAPGDFEGAGVCGEFEGEPGGEVVGTGLGEPEVGVAVAEVGEQAGDRSIGVAGEGAGEGEDLLAVPGGGKLPVTDPFRACCLKSLLEPLRGLAFSELCLNS